MPPLGLVRQALRSYTIGLFVVCSILILFIFQNSTTLAVDSSSTSLRGLTLSPLRSELNLAPGTSIDGFLTVTNSTDKLMTVFVNAESFSVINQQYDYDFTAESNIAKWATFKSEEIILEKGETKKIPYNIGVPLSAEPGGRYIGLFVSTDTEEINEGGVTSRQRIASLLYISVLGDVTRSGNLVKLSSPWFMDGEDFWSMTIQNTGTTHFRSRYNVVIYNLFSNKAINNASNDSLILPGTLRSLSDKIPLPKFPGVYKVVYEIGLGDTPAVFETRYVLYFPPIFLLITTVIIIMLIVKYRVYIYENRNKY